MLGVWFRRMSLVVLGGVLSAAILWAQTRVYIDINKVGGYLLPLALPKFVQENATTSLPQDIRTVLRQDLEVSGLFRVLDPATYIDPMPSAFGTVLYDNWALIGAVGVITGRLEQASDNTNITLELGLHDVAQRQLIAHREYLGAATRYREMAHRFGDHIFRAFTGEDGPFDTQVVCETSRQPADQGKDITIMDYDGYGGQRIVADGALNLAPILSPDGRYLAYTSYRAGSPDLYIRDMRTAREERLTTGPGLAVPGSWSADGRYLALNQTVAGNSDIFLYEIQSRRLSRLTRDWGIDVSPSFAPDSRRLVFTSDRGGSPQLYLTDTQGSTPVRLTYEGRYNSAPAWSPRNDTIAYVGRSEGGGFALYTIRADGQGLQQVAQGWAEIDAPSWAPNGRFVMYVSRRGSAWQRQIVREGGQGKPLPSADPMCFAPQWVARVAP